MPVSARERERRRGPRGAGPAAAAGGPGASPGVESTVAAPPGPGLDGIPAFAHVYVIVADGSLSRFGRALGTARNKAYPQGIAIRGYFDSPASTDPWIESCLDVRDRQGQSLPGYGWIFPLGDGTINVGIGLLSTFKGYRDVNTTHLMTEWAATAPERLGIDPDAMLAPPTGGRLPLAGAVHPHVGPNRLLGGGPPAAVTPFNRQGIG